MVLRRSLYLLALCGLTTLLAAQSPPDTSNVPSPNQAPATPATPPSTTLRPSLDVVKTALSQVQVNRWKASVPIRNEAETNVASIQKDVSSTLPTLLAAADTAPDSPAKVLPVYRNVEALYDVMLRVDAAARLAAPTDQMSALDQALARLDDGRRALGDQLQQISESQDIRVVHLQAALKAIPPPAPPPPAPVPVKCPVTPARKKPAAKPATAAATSQTTPATTPH
jgi:hypothetical protein